MDEEVKDSSFVKFELAKALRYNKDQGLAYMMIDKAIKISPEPVNFLSVKADWLIEDGLETEGNLLKEKTAELDASSLSIKE